MQTKPMKFKQVILGHWDGALVAVGMDGIVYQIGKGDSHWKALPSVVKVDD